MFKETTTFELKKKFTSNISISIAAFLNTNGGTLAMVADGPDFMTVDGVKKGIEKIINGLLSKQHHCSTT